MPRKRREAEKDEEPVVFTTTKVYPDVVHMAKMVSTHKKMRLYDYLDSVLRPVIEAEYNQIIKK